MGAPAFYTPCVAYKPRPLAAMVLLATVAAGRSINISLQGISSAVCPRSTVLPLRGKFQYTLSFFERKTLPATLYRPLTSSAMQLIKLTNQEETLYRRIVS